MKLYYCDTCGLRIPAEEIPTDVPEPDDGKFFCAKHRPETPEVAAAALARPPSKTMPAPVLSPQSSYSSRSKIAPATRSSARNINSASPSDPRRSPAGSQPTGPNNKLIWGGAGLVFVVLMLILAFSGSGKTRPAETQTTAVGSGTTIVDPQKLQAPVKTPDPAPTPEIVTPTPVTAAPTPTPTPAPIGTKKPDPRPAPPSKTPATNPAIPPTPLDPAVEAAAKPTPPDDPKNILKNPGFERGALNWEQFGTGKVVYDPVNAHSGKYCARVELDPKASVRQILPLIPSTRYTLSAWVKGSGAILGASDYGGPEVSVVAINDEYTRLSLSFTVAARAKSAKIFLHPGSAKIAFADEFSLIITPAETAAPKPPDDTPAEKFEAVQENSLVLLQQNKGDAALTALTEAKADPLLETYAADLDAATACMRGYDEIVKAGPDGVQKLSDGRAFTFKKRTGHDSPVGGASKAAVKEFKDGEISIETKDGGIIATEKFQFDELTEQCRLDLAALTLAPGSEKECKLAFAEMILLRSGRGGTAAGIRARIERAKKDPAVARVCDFLVRALELTLLNQRIDAALKKVEAAEQAGGDSTQAHLLWEAVKKEFGMTPLHVKKFLREHGELDLQPGLWTSYFSGPGGKEFEKYHLSRAETRLNLDWGTGSPDPSVPVDNFTGKFCGLLRVPKAGNYTFWGHGDDCIALTIDGKRILENNSNGIVEGKVTLTAGDHSVGIYHHEFGGGACLNLRWKLEGSFDYQDVPPAALWYDPTQKEQYQKGEK